MDGNTKNLLADSATTSSGTFINLNITYLCNNSNVVNYVFPKNVAFIFRTMQSTSRQNFFKGPIWLQFIHCVV